MSDERSGRYAADELTTCRVWTTTFNVNDSMPKETDLSSWLADTDGAELLIFGYSSVSHSFFSRSITDSSSDFRSSTSQPRPWYDTAPSARTSGGKLSRRP